MPSELCRPLCRGLAAQQQQQADAMGLFTLGGVNGASEENRHHAVESPKAFHEESNWEHAWDDAIGELLEFELAKQARRDVI